MHRSDTPSVRRLATAVLCAIAACCTQSRAAPAATLDGPPAKLLGNLVRVGDAYYAIAQGGGNACVPHIFIPPGLNGPHGAGGTPRFLGCGAILKLSAAGSVSVVYLFTPASGASPIALRAGANSTLIGVTTLGGRHGRGTVFRFTPATGHLDVLQDLDDNVDLYYGFYGYDAALDDGSAIVVDPAYAAVLAFRGGKPAQTLHRFPNGTHIGPVAIANDGRALFTVKTPAACDAAIDALALDGTLTELVPSDLATAPACSHAPVGDVLPIRIAGDGSIIANDDTNVYVAADGKPFSTAFSLSPASGAKNGTALIDTSAMLASNGDIDLAAIVPDGCGIVGHVHAGKLIVDANLPGTGRCFATDSEQSVALVGSDDGLFGAVYGRFDGGFTVAVPLGKPPVVSAVRAPVEVKSVAFVGGVSTGDQRGVVTWGAAYQDLGLPDLVVSSSSIDFELRRLSDANAKPVRLQPTSANIVRSSRTEMTMERYLSLKVTAALPAHLPPGRYEITGRAGSALRTTSGAVQPIVDDDARTYLLVTRHDVEPSAPDDELHRVRAAYAGKTVTVLRDFPVECQQPQDELIPAGTRLRVKSVARTEVSDPSFFGPLGLHDVPPGDIAPAYGPFAVPSPLFITFTGITFAGQDACTAAAMFAADWDVKRYLRP